MSHRFETRSRQPVINCEVSCLPRAVEPKEQQSERKIQRFVSAGKLLDLIIAADLNSKFDHVVFINGTLPTLRWNGVPEFRYDTIVIRLNQSLITLG